MEQHPDNVRLNVTVDEQAQSLLADAGTTLAEIPANTPAEPQQQPQLDMNKVIQFSRIEQQQPPQQPEPAASPTTPNAGLDMAQVLRLSQDASLDDKGVVATSLDAAHGLATGPAAAWNETMDFSYSTGKFVKDVIDKGWEQAKLERHQAPFFRIRVNEPDTTLGRAAQALSQTITGYVVMGQALKAGQVLQQGELITNVLRPMVQGAAGDFISAREQEERLSNFIIAYIPEEYRPAIAEYLAATGDEGLLEGKLKATLEGGVAGVILDSFVVTCRLVKALRKAGDSPEAQAKLLQKYGEDIQRYNEAHPETIKQNLPTKDKPATAPAAERRNVASTATASTETAAIPPKENSPSSPRPPKSTPSPLKGDELVSEREVRRIAEEVSDEGDLINIERESLTAAVGEAPLMGSETGGKFLEALSEKLAGRLERNRSKESFSKLTGKAIRDLNEAGLSYDKHIERAVNNKKLLRKIRTEALETAVFLNKIASETVRLSRLIAKGGGTIQDRVQLLMACKNVQEFYVANADLGTEWARGLNARKLGNNLSTEKVDTILTNKGTHELKPGEIIEPVLREGETRLTKRVSNWLSTNGMSESELHAWLGHEGLTVRQADELAQQIALNPNKVLANITGNMRRVNPEFSGWGATAEYVIGNLLSNIKTPLFDVFSGTIKTLYTPLENAVGGLINGDMDEFAKNLHIYRDMVGQGVITDSLRLGWQAFKTGDNILDRGARAFENYVPQISYERIRNSWLKNRPEGSELSPLEDIKAHIYGFLGTINNYGPRLMMTGEEVFKGINFRAHLKATLRAEAWDKGLKGKAADQYVKEGYEKAFAPNGSVIKEELTEASLKYARENTWTNPLDPKGWAQSLLNETNKHPTLKILCPFVRTPVNLFHDFMQHAPGFNFLYKDIRENFFKQGALGAQARGKFLTGVALSSLAYNWAAEGRLTGDYPRNPKVRDMWREKGIPPYSIRIGDSWVEYKRLDPFASILGSVANSWMVLDDLENDASSKSINKVVWGVTGSIIKGLGDKTYLQNWSELAAAYNDPDYKLEKFVGRLGASFLPLSALQRQVRNQFTDPIQRETETWLDQIKNASPFFSENLPARMSWITGKPLSTPSRTIKQEIDSDVMEEMLRLKDTLIGRPEYTFKGVRLDMSQYSRYCELHGGMKTPDGLTMHQRLSDLIKTPFYQNLPDGFPGEEGPKATLINNIIEMYRDMAGDQLRREFPELEKKITEQQITKQLSKAGAINKDNREQILQKLIH